MSKIDLNKGVNLKIEGEIGKYQTIPVDTLVKISQYFQELVLSLAKYDLSQAEGVDLNNFKLELSGFQKGSAVPQFSFTNRIQTTLNDYKAQREQVNERLTNLFEVADSGDYLSLKKIYKKRVARNEIVTCLHDFVNSFGDSPVEIVGGGKTMRRLFKVQKFKTHIKNELIEKPLKTTEAKIEDTIVGSIRITREGDKVIRKKVVEIYDDEHTTLSYSTREIIGASLKYTLNHPMRCLFVKQDDFYIIQNELLDIVGTGNSQTEAEHNFFKAFDYCYMRYNNPKITLSHRLIGVRSILRAVVKNVKKL